MPDERYVYPNYPDGKLDDEVALFLGRLAAAAAAGNSPPLSSLSPAAVRQGSDISGWTVLRCAVREKVDIEIPGPGGGLPLRIYVPDGEGPFPVLLYFHGGGFVFGTLNESDHICAAFAQRTPCVVVSVGYRLAPENKYPAAVEDAWAALTWVERNISAYGGNPRTMAVGGESAGANLATVICRIARDRQGPRIVYQLLLCPWTDLSSCDTRSCAEFGDGPWLPRRNLEYYRAQYLRDAAQASDPDVSPGLAEDLRGLPPAHVVTAEFDPLRDDGEAYAKRLRDAGVPTTLACYHGMIHVFMLLNAVFTRADQAIDDCAARLRAGTRGAR